MKTTTPSRKRARQTRKGTSKNAATPCASCPFLLMNHEEFGAVAERLCAKFGQPKPDFWACLSIRENVKADAIKNRRLQCHCTVYDAQMNPHPEASRPCAGLAAYLAGNADLRHSAGSAASQPKETTDEK